MTIFEEDASDAAKHGAQWNTPADARTAPAEEKLTLAEVLESSPAVGCR